MTMATLNGAAIGFVIWSAMMFRIAIIDLADREPTDAGWNTNWQAVIAWLSALLSLGGIVGTVVGRVL